MRYVYIVLTVFIAAVLSEVAIFLFDRSFFAGLGFTAFLAMIGLHFLRTVVLRSK